ncbi:MAG TPA: glycosyltransferase, partial [Thermoanaerobaculia bacterium]|nr:glycosyltransferase [Thermoanaerobaculia bacterium]
VVNYRTADLAAACVASLREAFAAAGISGEVLLVDCGSGQEEAAALTRIPSEALLCLEENRGYSGGANAGLARVRSDRVLLSNADVLFSADSLPPLLAAIERPEVGVAGPLCFWDSGEKLRMPPGYAPGLWRDWSQLSAGRWPSLDTPRFQSFALASLRLWREGGTVDHLTGAVLAARREVFDRVGRFDERFPFEYEESEWEDRLRGAGLELSYVVASRVRHLYGRAAGRDPSTAARRAESRDRYRRNRYGSFGSLLLEQAGRRAARVDAIPVQEPAVASSPGMRLAISPNPSLLPFADASLEEDFLLPEDVLPSLPPGPLYLRVFSESDGTHVATYVWEKAA